MLTTTQVLALKDKVYVVGRSSYLLSQIDIESINCFNCEWICLEDLKIIEGMWTTSWFEQCYEHFLE